MRASRALPFLVMLLPAGCKDEPPDEPPRACTTVDASCSPAYEPTYANVFANTLRPSCARSGVSCHASTGRQGDLGFYDAEVAYEDLGRSAVRPGDPACSELVVRVTATAPNVRMPPARALDAGEQCAIVRWIADGARR